MTDQLKALKARKASTVAEACEHFEYSPDPAATQALLHIVGTDRIRADTRESAVRALCFSRDGAAFDGLVEHLADPKVGPEIASYLGRFCLPSVIEPLRSYLTSPANISAYRAANGLGLMPYVADVFEALLEGVHDSRSDVRRWSIRNLQRVSVPATERQRVAAAVEAVAWQPDVDREVARDAAVTLGSLGVSIDFPLSLLQSDDEGVIAAGAEGLAQFGGAEALDALLEAYRNGKPVREPMLRLIARHGHPEHIETVVETLDDFAIAGAEALVGIGPSAVNAARSITDGYYSVFGWGALAALGEPDAVDELVALLDGEDRLFAGPLLMAAGHDQGLPATLEAAADNVALTYRPAIAALADHGDRRHCEYLEGLLHTDDNYKFGLLNRALHHLAG